MRETSSKTRSNDLGAGKALGTDMLEETIGGEKGATRAAKDGTVPPLTGMVGLWAMISMIFSPAPRPVRMLKTLSASDCIASVIVVL